MEGWREMDFDSCTRTPLALPLTGLLLALVLLLAHHSSSSASFQSGSSAATAAPACTSLGLSRQNTAATVTTASGSSSISLPIWCCAFWRLTACVGRNVASWG